MIQDLERGVQMLVDKPNLLVADDDANTRSHLSHFLSSRGYNVQCFDSGVHLLAHLASAQPPSLLILDVRMPPAGGLEVLAEMERLGRRIPAIVLSGVSQIATVVKAMRLGATDYLLKPLKDHELELAVERALEESGPAAAVEDVETNIAFPSSNARMLQIRRICDHVARADVPVLILGESGVGKEVVARYIHAESERKEPFVKVNCAAIPADLLESELFGHERGAFTGAMREKPGKFELAGEGTVLLDEISEMNPVLQAKLLHVLQDGEYSRLGGTRLLRSRARILATTNKPLQSLAASGTFREDLFFRLNVITIEIPPLRERPEDIVPLCRRFVAKYRAKYESSVEQLPAELELAFSRFSWPGNVRQLENAVKRFLILPDVQSALAELTHAAPQWLPPTSGNRGLREVSAMAAEQAEKEMILHALKEVNWNRTQAARRLNICYKSLLNKLHKWQIYGRFESDGRDGFSEEACAVSAAHGGHGENWALNVRT